MRHQQNTEQYKELLALLKVRYGDDVNAEVDKVLQHLLSKRIVSNNDNTVPVSLGRNDKDNIAICSLLSHNKVSNFKNRNAKKIESQTVVVTQDAVKTLQVYGDNIGEDFYSEYSDEQINCSTAMIDSFASIEMEVRGELCSSLAVKEKEQQVMLLIIPIFYYH